ncbi:MAG: GPR endopeptidase [Oscillospiraceae bacterium]
MIRTDLTTEAVSMMENSNGIVQSHRGEYFNITEVLISNEELGKRINRKVGKYITLESSEICKPTDDFENMAKELSEELKPLIPDGSVLISGLGNNDVTPDTLGVITARNILATRHFKQEIPEDKMLTSLREVSVISAGVLAQTGIESSEIIKSLVDKISPKCVIVIDAFACSDISRLGTTIQISDSGIHPGSGVNNSRKEISREVMGVPVIAIGVPTVVDMHTIAENLTGNAPGKDTPNLMVTPRNIDSMVEYSSKLLSEGISMALHPNLN